MIFEQRLLTILLGLLFAVVLTDQASALYDPGVGRFCSKAPIGKAESPFDLHETLDGYVVFGTDACGRKCCLRTYGDPRCRSGSHSVLECTKGYTQSIPIVRKRPSGSTTPIMARRNMIMTVLA